MFLHWCFVLVWCWTLALLTPDQSLVSLVTGSSVHRQGCSYTQIQLVGFPSQCLNNEWGPSSCAEWSNKSALKAKCQRRGFYALSLSGKVKNVRFTWIIRHWEVMIKCCYVYSGAPQKKKMLSNRIIWASSPSSAKDSYESILWCLPFKEKLSQNKSKVKLK